MWAACIRSQLSSFPAHFESFCQPVQVSLYGLQQSLERLVHLLVAVVHVHGAGKRQVTRGLQVGLPEADIEHPEKPNIADDAQHFITNNLKRKPGYQLKSIQLLKLCVPSSPQRTIGTARAHISGLLHKLWSGKSSKVPSTQEGLPHLCCSAAGPGQEALSTQLTAQETEGAQSETHPERQLWERPHSSA